MPEGHTLHRLAAQIQRLFVGKPWRVTSPQGRFAAGAQRLTERVPERAEAWGKQLFVHCGPDIWQVHLGLYGAFSFRGDQSFAGAETLGAPRTAGTEFTADYDDAGWILPEPPTASVRARVHVNNGWADLRGPSRCAVLNPMQYEALIARLGPDPLGAGRLEQFQANLRRRSIPIAAALMDQAVIAGVGNIYRAESLFGERLNPYTPAKELTDQESAALWSTITHQLRDGVREGIIRTYREPGRRRHWVYQHQSTPCLRCRETIQMQQLQGRRLYWCPGCQTA